VECTRRVIVTVPSLSRHCFFMLPLVYLFHFPPSGSSEMYALSPRRADPTMVDKGGSNTESDECCGTKQLDTAVVAVMLGVGLLCFELFCEFCWWHPRSTILGRGKAEGRPECPFL